MKYAVHCYDNKYGGLHGIYSDFTMETDNYAEVEEEAKNQAIELIQSYGFLLEELWEDASADDSVYNELIDEDAVYEIVPIRDEAPIFIEEDFSNFIKKWGLK